MNRRVLKYVAALVAVVAIVVLAVIALKTKGESTEQQGALVFTHTPASVLASRPPPLVREGESGGALSALPPEPSPTTSPGKVPPAEAPAPGGDVTAQLTCPAPLPPATHSGGLANLTPIIPLFGPYSAEAFTFVPAFEPAFPVLGPGFVAFGEFLETGQPLLDVALPLINAGEQSFYDATAPGYEAIRPQILAGEAQTAAGLRPLVAQLATTEGSGCVPDALDILLTPFL